MATSVVTPNTCCLTAQTFLDNVAKENKPMQIERGKLGLMKALYSPQNTKGTKMEFKRSDGKNLDVRFTYDLPQCLTATNTLAADPCVLGSAEASKRRELQLSVSKVVQIQKTFDPLTYISLCENKDDAMALHFMPMVQALKEAQNTELINMFKANLNNYFNGTTSAIGTPTVKTIKAFDNQFKPNTMGLFNVKQEYVRKGYSDTPFLIAGDTLSAINFARPLFSDNLDASKTFNGLAGFNFVEDFDIDTNIADGDAHAFTFMPGHNFIIEALKNVGEFEISKPNYRATTMNMGGYTFDYYEKETDCSTAVTITLEKRFDLFQLPANAFASCTSQPANLHYLLDCGDLSCSDGRVS